MLLHHNEHVHFDSYPKLTGETGSIVALDHGDNTRLELRRHRHRQRRPERHPNALRYCRTRSESRSRPSREELQFILRWQLWATPFTIMVPVNTVREIIAPLTQGNKTFKSWSERRSRHSFHCGRHAAGDLYGDLYEHEMNMN